MARHFSLKSFLRMAPKDLLERYLHGKSVAGDLKLRELKPKDWDQVYSAIVNAGERKGRAIDRDFREIHALADAGGTKVLIDEARNRHHSLDISGDIERLSDPLRSAFWVFLEHPRVFRVAKDLYHAEALRWRPWKDPIDGVPAVDDGTKKTLAEAISGYYRLKEGRGQGCHVEHWERGEKLYWLVYLADYATSVPAFDEQHTFVTDTQRLAFELAFVYDKQRRMLDACVPGDKRTLWELQRIFSKIVLAVDIGDTPSSETNYQLDPLLSREFVFGIKPEDKVLGVQVRTLRLGIIGGGSRKVTLDAGSPGVPHAIYDLLDELFRKESIPKALLEVASAQIRISFVPPAGSRSRTRTFSISRQTLALKHDPLDEKIRELVTRWGLDVSGQPKPDSPQSGRGKQRTLSV
ncbi:hypothetical protein LLH23_15090 [bacterium]|nr:hypothetical protein [bacterium]